MLDILIKYGEGYYSRENLFKILTSDSLLQQNQLLDIVNEDMIKAGIALEGAKIVNESFNPSYASEILTNKASIKKGIALSSANIINMFENDEYASLAHDVLTDEKHIQLGTALNIAKKLSHMEKAFNKMEKSVKRQDQKEKSIVKVIPRRIRRKND